ARKRRQERGVHVDDAHREGVEQRRRQEAHEPREHHELDASRPEDGDDRRVEVGPAGEGVVVEHDGLDAGVASTLERPRPGHVRDHDRDPRVEPLPANRVENGLEVRPAARDEDAQNDHAGHSTRSSNGRSGGTVTTRPSTNGASPAARSTSTARAAAPAGTTKTNPTPTLNVRRISASSTPPACFTRSKIGARAHACSTRSPRPSGRTRGRFPGIPPPVTWLIARTSTLAASIACTARG